MSAIVVILTFAGLFIPFFTYIMMLMPSLFALLAYRHPIKYGIAAAVASSLIIFLSTGLELGLFTAFYAGAGGLVIGWSMSRKKPQIMTIGLGSAVILGALIIILMWGQVLSGMDFTQMMQEQVNMMKEMIVTAQVEGDDVLTYLDDMMQLIKMMVPSIFVIMAILFSVINEGFTRFLIRRFGMSLPETSDFKYFTLPTNIVMGTLIIGGLSYLAGSLGFINRDVMLINVVSIFFFIFMIQGAASVLFFTEKWGITKGVRYFILVILFIFNAGMILTLIGWTDAVFKPRVRKAE